MTSLFGWTIPPVVYAISYAGMFVGAVSFLVVVSRKRVNGHEEVPSGGRENCPLVATRSALWWPPDVPVRRCQASGITPFPASAWDSRTLSPAVWQTCAWCISRSTVAVASVLGMSSSNADGCRFELIATLRFS